MKKIIYIFLAIILVYSISSYFEGGFGLDDYQRALEQKKQNTQDQEQTQLKKNLSDATKTDPSKLYISSQLQTQIDKSRENNADYFESYNTASYIDSYIDCLEWVDSTAFNAVGYHEDDSVLVVEFLESGSVYAYYGVPYYEYEEMIYSDSLGGYYNDYIKGYYDSERLL